MTLRILLPVLGPHRRAPQAALRGERREIAHFLLNTNLVGILRAASSKLDTLLIGALATPAAVSLYRIAVQFGTVPLLASSALHTAVFPFFSRAYALGRFGEIRHVALRASALLAAVFVPAAAVLSFQGGALIGAVAGPAYAGAGTPFAIVLLAVVPYVVLFWMHPLILTAGHARPLLTMGAVATVVQIGLLAVLVPIVPATGAAVALAAMYVVATLLHARFVWRRRLFAPAPRAA